MSAPKMPEPPPIPPYTPPPTRDNDSRPRESSMKYQRAIAKLMARHSTILGGSVDEDGVKKKTLLGN